jgi:hypothetical protein
MLTRLRPEVNQWWVASVLQFLIRSLPFAGNLCSRNKRRRVIKLQHCTPSYKWTNSFKERLRRWLPHPHSRPRFLAACLLVHPLISYFLLAFGFPGSCSLPGPLMYYGVIAPPNGVLARS